MTIKEAILKSLEEMQLPANAKDIYDYILKKNYFVFDGLTPENTISARLGDFIRLGDTRVKRIKQTNGTFSYYLTKKEDSINIGFIAPDKVLEIKKINKSSNAYDERDLHKLLSSYLKNANIYSKTIFHEQSLSSKDNHQKWIHPDMVGIRFLNLKSKTGLLFLKTINRADTFEITSYEIKKEINSDYELKKCFFQAVSNSSWANYGYLVAFEISDNLKDEMERLNQSFGIGLIELKSNPYESKILFPAKYKTLDFKTIDKLCNINPEFERLIEQIEKLMTAAEKYVKATEKELEEFCDTYFANDIEVEKYCKDKNIPLL